MNASLKFLILFTLQQLFQKVSFLILLGLKEEKIFELVYSEQVPEKKLPINLRRTFHESLMYPISELKQESGKRMPKVSSS